MKWKCTSMFFGLSYSSSHIFWFHFWSTSVNRQHSGPTFIWSTGSYVLFPSEQICVSSSISVILFSSFLFVSTNFPFFPYADSWGYFFVLFGDFVVYWNFEYLVKKTKYSTNVCKRTSNLLCLLSSQLGWTSVPVLVYISVTIMNLQPSSNLKSIFHLLYRLLRIFSILCTVGYTHNSKFLTK